MSAETPKPWSNDRCWRWTSGGKVMTDQTDEVSEESLTARMRSLDSQSIELITKKYGRIAFGLALRVLNDFDAAQDVYQEALLRIWLDAPMFDAKRGSLRTWILSIVYHRAIDHTRRRANQRKDMQVQLAEDALTAPDPWEMIADDVERDLLRHAISLLPWEQRRTVEFAYFSDLSQAQIASLMGVPVSTVKGRMRLAIQKLRTILGDFDVQAGQQVPHWVMKAREAQINEPQ